ncbi:glycosyl hydrolase family 18 protein [Clostridium sp.]|uniref:glycosyl hydrolase family 18 protein n=1 Tax=Clostridium sp. TaxID=1506 RepID=UPI003217A5F8
MNKKMKNTWIFVTVILITSTLLYGCSKGNNLNESNDKEENEQIIINEDKRIFDENIDNLSAWIAYWDLDVNEELKILDKQLKEISYFGAYFDSHNELVMTQQLVNYYNETKNQDYIKYLTIVNDKINSDGTSLLKDTHLLKSLLTDSTLRSKHVKDIINLASQYGFDGIEIDYEQIKGDMELWNNYLLFINELYNESEMAGLKLRVILEPNTPFDNIEFAEGPTYVMMCYNLHGGFSEPGEKSNSNFIKELIDKMEKVPGNKSFAIATGGFNWRSDGKVTSLSEVEAKELVKEYNAKEEVEAESQCMVFKYTDEAGIEHEVWYANKNTLSSWMKVIEEKGYGISLWRLGGNLFR